MRPPGFSASLLLAWWLLDAGSSPAPHYLRDNRSARYTPIALSPPRHLEEEQREVQADGKTVAVATAVAAAAAAAGASSGISRTDDPVANSRTRTTREEWEQEDLEWWCDEQVRVAREEGWGSHRAGRLEPSRKERLGGGGGGYAGGAVSGDDEEEDEEGLLRELVAGVWRAYGRVKQAEVIKELYLHFAGRDHPFPFCAWQVEFDPRVLTPVLLDTNSVYRLQALHFTTTADVFRIRGRFPRVRYFSFQSYDSHGQPLSTLPDFLVRPHDGHHPFITPMPPPTTTTTTNSASSASSSELSDEGTFEVYVTANGRHGYPNELAGLQPDYYHHHHHQEAGGTAVGVVKTTTIIYRLYGADPTTIRTGGGGGGGGVDDGLCSWGFVEPPVVEKRVLGGRQGEWEVLPLCSHEDTDRLAQRFVQIDQRLLATKPPQESVCGLYDKAGKGLQVVNATYPFGHLESPDVHAYVVYTNKDSNYLYWCDSVRRLLGTTTTTTDQATTSSSFVLVLRGRLPTTPTGLFHETRIAEAGCYDARYVSISTVENMAPSNTYHSISDAQLQEHYSYHQQGAEAWDRWYRVVAATDPAAARACGLLGPSDVFLPFARQGMGPPRLPGIVYREILSRYRVMGEPDASAAYLQSVCDADNVECSTAAWRLEALSRAVMKDAYPVIEVYRCDAATGQRVRLAP